MYDIKALYEAASVEEAIALLQAHPQAQIIAGGSDVLVQIREGRRAGTELVSIFGIDALRGVTLDGEGAIRIGSLTSFSHIAKSPIIREKIAVLGEAVSMVGGPQIRNIGTIGGNTCNGVTSADSPSRISISKPAWWTCGPPSCKPPSSFPGRPGRDTTGTTSNTPCARPWTSPTWAAR